MGRTIGRLSALRVDRIQDPGMHPDGGSLYLQCTRSAAGHINKSWLFRFEVDGRERQMGLGSLATVSLAEARTRAADALRLREQGIDPIDHRDAQRTALALQAAKAVTFKQAAADYIRQHQDGWRNRQHRQQWINTLQQYAEPVLGDIAVAAIDTDLVLQVLRPIWLEINETARRLRARIEAVINFAVTDGGANPARWKGHLEHKLDKRIRKVRGIKHLAAVPHAEVPGFLAELRQRQGRDARALEFLILTAGRTGEVIGARWDEIDLEAGIWSVPAARMKSGRPHRVPLSDRATEILKAQAALRENDHVFPGARRHELSTSALLELIKRMGRSECVHGFRSSFRDWCGDAGVPRELAEASLAHANPDATEAAYLRTDALERRRRLMNAWSTYCDGAPGADVLPLRGRR
ncbi:MAG TPA: tyrosine-type recombinase/integrase [Xanthobacteraceae bacterium]